MRWVVLLAGGSGTRLWPVSHCGEPKQFLPILHGKSLIESSYERMLKIVPKERLLVCAAERHRKRGQKLIPSLPDANYFGEPTGRDTLAAIALSCSLVQLRDPDAVISIIPIDQSSGPDRIFYEAMENGYAFVEQHREKLLTFGICPTEAATGYGYLECECEADTMNVCHPNVGDKTDPVGPYTANGYNGDKSFSYTIYELRRFLEKPNRSLAEKFWLAGPKEFLWNAGMFLWHVQTFLDLLKRYESDVFETMSKVTQAWETIGYPSVLSDNYANIPKISIDYAVMERAASPQEKRVMTLPMPRDFQWQDIGTWDSVAKLYPADVHGNTQCSNREVLFIGSENCFAFTDPLCTHKRKIRFVHVNNVIVVETPQTILVCDCKATEQVRMAAKLRFHSRPHAVQGRGRFIASFDSRLAIDHCRQNIVAIGLNEIDLLVAKESITIVPAERPERYEAFPTLRRLDWIPIRTDG